MLAVQAIQGKDGSEYIIEVKDHPLEYSSTKYHQSSATLITARVFIISYNL